MVVIGLDVSDFDSLDSFMTTVAETFRNQRMCSPPETTGLFITLIGSLSAESFKEQWLKVIEDDPISKFFMTQMTEATVLHGKPDGSVIEHISLI